MKLGIFLIQFYKVFLSPALGGHCRFYPSCSDYCHEALANQGIKSLPVLIGRIVRCHPFSRGGYDPVLKNPRKVTRSKSFIGLGANHTKG